MNKIIMNEKRYVESIIDSTTIPDDLSIGRYIVYLTKYCYEKNMSCEECIKYISNLFNKYNFSVVEYQEYIMADTVKKYYKSIKSGKTQLLKEVDSIPIYQSDLDFINSCENNRQKKFLFTIYVLARFTNRYGWVYQQRGDLYKLANIGSVSKNKSNIVYELHNMGLLKLTKKVTDNKVGIDNIYIPYDGEVPVFEITNLEHIGNQYINYVNKNKNICKRCGKLIITKTTGRKPLYCDKCAKELHMEHDRIYQLNKRNQNSSTKTHLQFNQ